MNRPTAWIAPAALGLGLGAVLALWTIYPTEDPPAWVPAASVGTVALALFVAIVGERQDRRRQAATGPPRAASVPEFLAAVDRLYGTGGADSGAAVGFLGHDHRPDAPPCAACLAIIAPLLDIAGLQADAAERLAAPGELAVPEASGVILCGELLGTHRCERREAHDTHRCECGTVWGRTSALGIEYPFTGKQLPPFRG